MLHTRLTLPSQVKSVSLKEGNFRAREGQFLCCLKVGKKTQKREAENVIEEKEPDSLREEEKEMIV